MSHKKKEKNYLEEEPERYGIEKAAARTSAPMMTAGRYDERGEDGSSSETMLVRNVVASAWMSSTYPIDLKPWILGTDVSIFQSVDVW
jgi:hypothetical protein